jgi:hypothetical protein
MGPRDEKFWEWESEELKGCCFRNLKCKHAFCDFAACLLNNACVENEGKRTNSTLISCIEFRITDIQGDQKVFLDLMITIQKDTSNVQSVPRQSPNIY